MKRTWTIIVLALVSVLVLLCVMSASATAADFWLPDSDITSGLPDVGGNSAPTVFYKDGTWYLISGSVGGTFNGFKWSDSSSTWQSDLAIVSGLGSIPDWSAPTVFYKDGTWYLISGEVYGVFYGFKWSDSGSTWQSDPAIVSGLDDVAYTSKPAVFYREGTWHLIAGEMHGGFYGFKWSDSGSTWQSDPAVVSGLGDVGYHTKPAVFYQYGTWYQIAGEWGGGFFGWNWSDSGSAWQAHDAIVSGMEDIGSRSTPAVFDMNGTWYLMSGEEGGAFYGFRLRSPIQVNKTVWNPVNETWAKEITANAGDTLRFRCVVSTEPHNYDLTNISVIDVLPDILEYKNNATVNGVPHEPVQHGKDYEWNFSALPQGKNITIEFDAQVVKCGSGTNVVNGTAWCEQSGTWVSDADHLSIIVLYPSIEVDKTVWNPVSETWAGEIWANVSDTMRFRCVVHNSGTYNLTNVTAADFLPAILNYSAGGATVNGVPHEPTEINPNEYEWNFTGPIAPGENITIEFNATAVMCGSGENVHNATAWCPAAAEWVSGEDTVGVSASVISSIIEVNKTVWDTVNGTWVKEFEANAGDTLRFRCVIHSGPYNLTNVTAADILPDLLEYKNNATVNGVPQEPVQYGSEYEWNVTGPIAPGENVIIEFDATAVQCGSDTNVHNATAWCAATAEWVSDADLVSITVPGPSIEVDKTVWSPATETWVNEFTAKLNDTLRFRCVVRNSGTYSLTDITAVDILPSILEYKNNATVNGVPQEPVQSGSEYEWNFSALAPGENVTIEFDATAVQCGSDTNVHNATAWCEQAGTWAEDEDSVLVIVSKPDLMVTEIETPAFIIANRSNSITAVIANVGDVNVDAGLFNVSLSANEAEVFHASIATGLSAGASTTVSFLWTPSHAGEYELRVVADCDFDVDESDETNNELTKIVLVVEPTIDLIPTSLDIPPLLVNHSNVIRAAVRNNGTVNPGSFNVSLSANATLIHTATVAGLGAAGASETVSFLWTPTHTGNYELRVAADCDFDVDESNETNNELTRLVEVVEGVCWNDSFDDETKIAEKSDVIVKDGDVEINFENVSWSWRSDSSASGLPDNSVPFGKPSYAYTPAVAFNVTGDGRWNLVAGNSSGEFHGFYRDGSSELWVSDSSFVAGLGDVGDHPAPAIAFNVTGDGKWNLIAGNSSGEFHGFKWNGPAEQWVSDFSLVAGLGDVENYSAPAIAFNVTGDGRWNMIAGNSSGEFNGFYWNGMQWISDSSLVAGLEDVGSDSLPAIAFNITWDGKWNLISGSGGSGCSFDGYYWNGSQWLSDSALVAGLPGGIHDVRRRAPAIAFNVTGDGGWNLVSGDSGTCYPSKNFWRFSGYARAAQPGSVKSVLIPPSYFKNWAVFNANDSVPTGTEITYKILDWNNNVIMTVVNGQNISGISQTSIKLCAELTTVNPSYTPVMHDWGVCWQEGPVDLLPTAIEMPSELYANVSWRIIVPVRNNGSAHSGRFNVSLYANDTRGDTKLIDDIPAGESTNVTLVWTPTQPGCYNLTVIADSDDAIAETNETNNNLTKEVSVMQSNLRRLTFDSNSSIDPDFATDSSGNIHVVWSDTRDGGAYYNPYYKKLAPDGTVLVDDKCIGSGGWRSSSTPKIAIDPNDNIHVVFMFRNDTYIRKFNIYTKLDNDGNVLIEPKSAIDLPPPEGIEEDLYEYAIREITADHEGNLHAVVFYSYSYFSGWYWYTVYELVYVKLDNECNELLNYTIDSALGPPSKSGTGDNIELTSGIVVDSGGNGYITYMKGLGSCNSGWYYNCSDFPCWWPACAKPYYAKLDDAGAQIQELTGDCDLPLPSAYPDVCIDSSDNKYVIWSQHNRSVTVIYYNRLVAI